MSTPANAATKQRSLSNPIAIPSKKKVSPRTLKHFKTPPSDPSSVQEREMLRETERTLPVYELAKQVFSRAKEPFETTSEENSYSITNDHCKKTCELVLSIIEEDFSQNEYDPELLTAITLREMFENDLESSVKKTIDLLEGIQDDKILRLSPRPTDSLLFTQALKKVQESTIQNLWLEKQPKELKEQLLEAACARCMPQ